MSSKPSPAFDFFAPRKPKRDAPSSNEPATSSEPPTKKSKGEAPAEVTKEATATPSSAASSASAQLATAKAWNLPAQKIGSVNSSVNEEDEHNVDEDELEEMEAQFGGANGADEDNEELVKEEQDEENAIMAAVKAASSPAVKELQEMFGIFEKGNPVPYLVLARAFREIHLTRSKLRHIEVVREFFRAVLERTPSELVPCIFLATNKLAPQFEGVELGIGDMIMQKAIMEATGKSLKNLKAEYKKLGDLGLVAQASIKTIRTLVPPKPLTVLGVFEHLKAIAAERGNASQKKKQDRIRSLLVACKEYESMYIIKALQGKMRINLGMKTVIAGLAHAFAYYESKGVPNEQLLAKSNKLLRAAFARRPDWNVVVKAVLEKGLEKLPETCQLTIGVPVEPMLAQPTDGVEAILHRLQGHSIFTAEYKYDGERAQVHLLPNGTVKIYSRNLEDNTGRFPDIIKRLPTCYSDPEGTKSFILDCEAVAYDLAADKILPYQVLSTRSRKDVAIETIKVQVCLYVFDVLYWNGESLLDKSLKERRELMAQKFHLVPGEMHFATHREFDNSEELEAFFTEAIDNQCEGLMIKTWDTSAQYEPARRSPLWLKFKKDYKEGLADSVDLVPIGAWFGKGKRTGVYGAYLLACYNDETEEYQSACKIGTGFSDVHLQELTKKMQEHLVDEMPPYFSTGDALKPDVWFSPVTVWEIRAADLSLSPQHKAAIGMVATTRGVGLRFPRFLRIREDKSPEQATNAEQIADLYRGQKIHTGAKSQSFADDGADY
jgi:DNA ligase-1